MELIATGRTADVFALDSRRVLRRYRSNSTALAEAKIMEHVRGHGFPVPAVHDATETDLVLERLPGPTMLQALSRRPWKVLRYGRQLGELHDRLHRVPAPDWLPGDGGQVLHLDFHPGNVILTPGGPSVIDWCNARSGEPAVDVATTLVLLTTGEAPKGVERLARKVISGAFLRGSRTDPKPGLRAATQARLGDPNTTGAERVLLLGILERC
ncbi:phosphotransferase [Nonomuraea soli]|uniref:Ser/Thr protein kinase RdoA (MazF antagonist) n=1 Tax=Nonomuraea soli TaxID=1032476 RepID=A0A7W0CRB0_9ACTN|nr:phosphotransferase [Nonomuraea soli]MBA2895903.1 Ser/Thr protein kinase RdoA (MazF antagonist) [Nonomuraea soli]